MPDIIEQLEEGRKIQKEKGINVDSLLTKINNKDEKQNKDIENIEKLDNINIEQDTLKQNTIIDYGQEKYPNFDFSNFYEIGQTIFFIRINKINGTKEFMELKIRTIYPKLLIGYEKGRATQCIGSDSKDLIFTKREDALKAYNKIVIIPRFKEETQNKELLKQEDENE